MTVSIKSSYLNQFREINIARTQESGAELGDSPAPSEIIPLVWKRCAAVSVD